MGVSCELLGENRPRYIGSNPNSEFSLKLVVATPMPTFALFLEITIFTYNCCIFQSFNYSEAVKA